MSTNRSLALSAERDTVGAEREIATAEGDGASKPVHRASYKDRRSQSASRSPSPAPAIEASQTGGDSGVDDVAHSRSGSSHRERRIRTIAAEPPLKGAPEGDDVQAGGGRSRSLYKDRRSRTSAAEPAEADATEGNGAAGDVTLARVGS